MVEILSNFGTGEFQQFTVSSYLCNSKQSYFDIQEFVEDSLFDLFGDAFEFDAVVKDDVFPIVLKRFTSKSILKYALSILDIVNIELSYPCMDIPYLYAFSSGDFVALVFDNSNQYLAVFFKRVTA